MLPSISSMTAWSAKHMKCVENVKENISDVKCISDFFDVILDYKNFDCWTTHKEITSETHWISTPITTSIVTSESELDKPKQIILNTHS